MTVRPAQSNAASTTHVGRQPVYDRGGDVIGYELLFREGAHATTATRRNAYATSQVIIAAFTEFGLAELVGDRPCFVNLTREFLVGELPIPFDYNQTVLEVLETIHVDDEVVTGIGNLVERGYTIALDDFVYTEHTARLLPLASFVKVDMLDADPDTLQDTVTRLRQHPHLTLVAERLETEQQLTHAADLGFDLFQGHVLGRPHVTTTHTLSPSDMRRLELLTALHDDDADIGHIADLTATDPALALRVLRASNSAASGMTKTVDSIRDAVILLGLQRIRDWVTLMVISDMTHATDDQLTTTLIRGRMCHSLADDRGLSPDAAFTVGLLSGVADLINQPIGDLVRSLPLAPDITRALTDHEGPFGDVLATIRAYENTSTDTADDLATAYLAALAWSNRTLVPVSAADSTRV